MSLRLGTALIGVFVLGNGLFGLVDPMKLMHIMGLAPLTPTEPAAALGEIRAAYGGVLTLTGAWLLLASLDLPRYRMSVLFIGLLWLSGFTGRLLSVVLFGDGSPGFWAWVAAATELVVGGALVAIAAASRRPESQT